MPNAWLTRRVLNLDAPRAGGSVPAAEAAEALRTLGNALKVEAIDDDEDTTRQIASFIANIFAAGTEVADTRSWTMLPDRIHIARLRLPEGTHRISVEVLDARMTYPQTQARL